MKRLRWLLVLALVGQIPLVEAIAGETPKASDPCRAAAALVGRLLPRHVDRFAFEILPASQGQAQDVFEIESVGRRVVIRGNTALSMATGLNWYLKHYAHCDVSWCGNQLNLPEPLPRVEPKLRRTSWAAHRYFLNYCAFGYSLPWWDWPQWERLIDWMALNGVDLPLSVTGQEGVWQAVGRRLGMDEKAVSRFLAGPPFLPFQWMGCLDSHGGPLPASWTARHEELQRQILARERELGMRPVLQGFTGHVPPDVARLFPQARLQKIKWIEWETNLLDPLDPLFARIASMFLEEQSRRFGSDHYYAADTFIEMVPPSGDLKYLAALGKAIYDGMAKSDPRAVWVLQGWAFMFKRDFWTQDRIRAILDAIPNQRMLILDLFCESNPMWSRTEGFCGKPWLWCNVQSFGATVGLGAALGRNNEGVFAARKDALGGRLAGLGFVNEGLCYNPVAYDLLFELAWRNEPVALPAWIAEYAHHRYGKSVPAATRAWEALLEVAFNTPTRSVSTVTAAPKLGRFPGKPARDATRLFDAGRDLLEAAPAVGSCDTYRFDLVNVTRQVLADHATQVHGRLAKAWGAKDVDGFARGQKEFLDLITDLDELLATRPEFLLGRCLEDAKRWGATPAEQARCEWNARRVLTLWGDTGALNDYARKQWSGMLSGYYRPRWQRFLEAAGESLRSGKPFNETKLREELIGWTADWASRRETYPAAPRGDSLAVARRLWEKYAESLKRQPVTRDSVSLTTDKPASCSHALGSYPAHLANDGIASDSDAYWATDVQRDPAAWWQVDFQKPTVVGRVVVVAYFADTRRYGFTVEVSGDGKQWEMVADRRQNPQPSTPDGYTCTFSPRAVRYLRVTQTFNSANTGRHLVEVMAFEQ